MKQEKKEPGMPEKRAFERAEMAFVRLSRADVIATSNGTGIDGSEDWFEPFNPDGTENVR